MGSIKGQKHNPHIDGKYAHLNPNDVVFTPDWLAKQICGMFAIDGKVLEPCKGEGAFLKHLPKNTDWCEIAEGRNYYDYNEKVDWIVTNPPYSDYNRFLEHSFALADNIVLLVPVSKMFKSLGTLKLIFEYGGFVSIHTLPASKAGFPFGFPCAVYYLKRGYKGETKIEMLQCRDNVRLDLFDISEPKMPSVNESMDADKWVRVKDRLPEELKNVLVTINYDENVHTAYVKNGVWHACVSDEVEIIGDAWLKTEIDHNELGVVAWQEIPKRAEWVTLENNLY